MSPFSRWMLRRIVAREVVQGYDHPRRIMALYTEIRRAAEREFYEDNEPTRDDYLREWFEASLHDITPQAGACVKGAA